MKHDCNGSWFQVDLAHWYYRCLYDGSLIKDIDEGYPKANGEECPECQRKVEGENRGMLDSQTQTITYVDMPFAGGTVKIVLDEEVE